MPAVCHARRGPFVGSRPLAVRAPSGIGWSPSWSVREWAPGLFTTSLDVASLKLSTATTRYVDVATGSDANTGLVLASPKKSIWSAINVGANDTIYVKGSANRATPTLYNGEDYGWLSNPVQSCNFIVVSDFTTLAPGWAVVSTGMVPGSFRMGTFALTADAAGPHVYEATLAAAPTGVIDASILASSGAPSALTSRASIALVEANPGSYYHDGATKVYVRAADSRAPDANLRVLRSTTNGWVNSAVDLYVERLTFEGGNQRAFYGQRYQTATFVDCDFVCSSRQGMELNTSTAGVTQTTYLIRCRALGNAGDGFGATASGAGTIVRWYEQDCETAGNSGSGADEGSSVHKSAGNGAVSAIRVGGLYHGDKTAGVADVGGMTTWMLGSRVYSEAGTAGIYIGDASTAWLHGCVLTVNATDLATDNASGVINVSGTTYTTASGAGTVAVYSP